jgi:hypothetical protein
VNGAGAQDVSPEEMKRLQREIDTIGLRTRPWKA